MDKAELRLREVTAFGMTDYRVFQLAASCVYGSTQRVAKAIQKRAQLHCLPLISVENQLQLEGYSANTAQGEILVGSLQFMRQNKIELQYAMGIMRMYISRGFIVRFVSAKNKLCGILAFDVIFVKQIKPRMAHNAQSLAHTIKELANEGGESK